MITRRRLLQTPGVGAMLAGLDLAFPRVFTTGAEAQSVLSLSPMLPEGTRAEAKFAEAMPLWAAAQAAFEDEVGRERAIRFRDGILEFKLGE